MLQKAFANKIKIKLFFVVKIGQMHDWVFKWQSELSFDLHINVVLQGFNIEKIKWK
jgi:hypothetical protein